MVSSMCDIGQYCDMTSWAGVWAALLSDLEPDFSGNRNTYECGVDDSHPVVVLML